MWPTTPFAVKDWPTLFKGATVLVSTTISISKDSVLSEALVTVSKPFAMLSSHVIVTAQLLSTSKALCVRVDVASIDLKKIQFDRALERSNDHGIFTGI